MGNNVVALKPTRWWRRNGSQELALPATAKPTYAQRKADVREAKDRLAQTRLEREQAIQEWDELVEQRAEDVVHMEALYAQEILNDLHDEDMNFRHLAEQAKKARKPAEPEDFEPAYKFEE